MNELAPGMEEEAEMGNPVVHFDILGADAAALSEFYSQLFGWHIQEVPGANYWLIDTHAGAGINGGTMSSDIGDRRLTFYAEAPDLEAVLERVRSAGGTIAVGVTETPFVTWALVEDPQGNKVGIVKTADAEAPGVSPGEGAEVSWWELLGPDPKALVSFYREVFGWEPEPSDAQSEWEYHEVHVTDGHGISGGIGSSPDGQGHVNVYARVDDPQKYLEKAESLGGKTVVPPMAVGEHTTFAQLADPQGIVFGLYQLRE